MHDPHNEDEVSWDWDVLHRPKEDGPGREFDPERGKTQRHNGTAAFRIMRRSHLLGWQMLSPIVTIHPHQGSASSRDGRWR
jgi:hypothetical protein